MSQSSEYFPASASSIASSVLGPEDERELIRDSVRLLFINNPSLAVEFIRGLTVLPVGWCKISQLRPSKANGYIQVSYGGANKFATLQDIVLWSKGLEVYAGHQVSHLCGMPGCTVASHIACETELENQRRKGCPVWVSCPHIGCSLKVDCCTHKPRCIKYCTEFLDHDQFLLHGLHV